MILGLLAADRTGDFTSSPSSRLPDRFVPGGDLTRGKDASGGWPVRTARTMKILISRTRRLAVSGSHGWLLVMLVAGCFLAGQESHGCSIRRNVGNHVSPNKVNPNLKPAGQCQCCQSSTGVQALLHKSLAAHTSLTRTPHVTTASLAHHAVAPHTVTHHAIAHHNVHKNSTAVHHSATGTPVKHHSLAATTAACHCICKPSITSPSLVRPPVVPPVVMPENTVPEPASLVTASLLGAAGVWARRRLRAPKTAG